MEEHTRNIFLRRPLKCTSVEEDKNEHVTGFLPCSQRQSGFGHRMLAINS